MKYFLSDSGTDVIRVQGLLKSRTSVSQTCCMPWTVQRPPAANKTRRMTVFAIYFNSSPCSCLFAPSCVNKLAATRVLKAHRRLLAILDRRAVTAAAAAFVRKLIIRLSSLAIRCLNTPLPPLSSAVGEPPPSVPPFLSGVRSVRLTDHALGGGFASNEKLCRALASLARSVMRC